MLNKPKDYVHTTTIATTATIIVMATITEAKVTTLKLSVNV